ncbi:SRPBCC domain-containing protein [Actinoplanes sp. TFC3]|uniref:SRPBCC family protein n=1 Tax=Actinoplanes sp. TFC3 TaxID=1710355 RepID=UPI0008376B84|nr:SRPBCC domain-containing protein [Actinoplanes sp. TFC3]
MSEDSKLVITRIFDAPRPVVFQAFTDPDQLAQWFAPVGMSVPRETVDVDNRVGGHQRFTMVNDSDPEHRMPVSAVFTEFVENEVIAGEEDITDNADVPGDRLLMRIEFFDEADDRTRIVLTQGPFTQQWRDGANEGWTSSFTKLDKILSR